MALSESLGIFQSDVVIRSALLEGVADLRRNPYLLDHVFASLKYDKLTAAKYGQSAIDVAKDFFLKTEIPVMMAQNDVVKDSTPAWAITINIEASAEAENTLADVHYITSETETLDTAVKPLTSAFNPVSYDPETGRVVVPEFVRKFRIFPGMVVVTKTGQKYEIAQVVDNESFFIEPGLIIDLYGCYIRPKAPTQVTALESAIFRETYSIGCHASGHDYRLIWLHSIVTFILLRYRQDLLEARGFERSTISSQGTRQESAMEAEMYYSRYINITGMVRNYWPKITRTKLAGVDMGLVVSGAGNVPLNPPETIDDLAWIGELDAFGNKS